MDLCWPFSLIIVFISGFGFQYIEVEVNSSKFFKEGTPIRDSNDFVDNELTVKRYKTNGKNIVLEPENPKYKPITVEKESEGYIWGVVTNVIHNL